MTHDRRLRAAMVALAVAGLAVSAYLTYVHYAEIKPICSGVSDCEKVQNSEYAKFLGIPVALLGLLGYAAILVTLFVPGETALLTTTLLTFVGFGFSAYLTYLELDVIDAICQWCVVSAILMTALAILATIRLLRGAPEPASPKTAV